MPSNETEDITATEELESPETELEQDDLPDELPEDPAELKKVAATAISLAKSAKQREAALQSEKERLEENLQDERTNSQFWSKDAQAKRAELERLGNGKAVEKKAPEVNDDEELAVLITEGMKLSDLKRMWQADADRRVNYERQALTSQGSHVQRIVSEYPELQDQNSPLARNTIAEMEALAREMPDLSDTARLELAARRAAGRIGYTQQSKAKSPEQVERDRRVKAQGGPTGKATPTKGAVVITDQDRKDAARMNGGQPLDDKYILAAKKSLQEGRQQQRA
jgi:hypothetical protein